MSQISRRNILAGMLGLPAMSLLTVACNVDKAAIEALKGSFVPVNGAVATLTDSNNELVLFSADSSLVLKQQRIAVGEMASSFSVSADGEFVIVLSDGVEAEYEKNNVSASVTVIDLRDPKAPKSKILDSNSRYNQVIFDEAGQWVLLSGTSTGLIGNPNEVGLINLSAAEPKLVEKTFRSYGSSPKGFHFTPEMSVPSGKTRFLVATTDLELHLLDLDLLSEDVKEITIRHGELSQGVFTRQLRSFAGNDEHAAAIAVLAVGQRDVLYVRFGESTEAGQPYSVIPSLQTGPGILRDIDFVNTDQGMRLAAVGGSFAYLLNTEDGSSESIQLSINASFLSASADPAEGATTDVALIWGTSEQVVIWTLGKVENRPFRSVETLELGNVPNRILRLPGEANSALRLITVQTERRFHVLDLENRQSSPLDSQEDSIQFNITPDGKRVWAFAEYNRNVSAISIPELSRDNLVVRERPTSVIEVLSQKRRLLFVQSYSGSLQLFDLDSKDGPTSRNYEYPLIQADIL